jgi:hypothetical protein
MVDGQAGLGIRFSDVVFDDPLSGAPFAGPVMGGLIGGVCVELHRSATDERS